MSFQVFRMSALAAVSAFTLSHTAFAQTHHRHVTPAGTVTVTLEGTLGPVISGSDPAGLDGQSATVTVLADESLTPFKTKGKSASYHIPAGDVTVDIEGTEYSSTSQSTMTVKLGKKSNTLTLSASLDVEGVKVDVTDVSSLAAKSWKKSVLQHPAPFSPSPQTLTEPASNLTYSVFGEKTKLGVSGTISNSD